MPVFELGHPKYGGRKKGTPNKNTIAKQSCDDLGCNPFQILIDIAMNSPEEGLRLSAAKELCQYLAPKLKAVEHSGSVDGSGEPQPKPSPDEIAEAILKVKQRERGA